jgi:predicted lipase
VAGHSLGGAIATLATYEIKKIYPNDDVKTYIFGAPRVGNKAFYLKFKSMTDNNVFRVVHMDDVVPHIPVDFSNDGYHHIQQEVWYNDETDPLKYK